MLGLRSHCPKLPGFVHGAHYRVRIQSLILEASLSFLRISFTIYFLLANLKQIKFNLPFSWR